MDMLSRLVVAACVIVSLGLAWILYRRSEQPIVLPKPRGPHAVGRVLFHWTDDRRQRELMVFVWYPAAPGTVGPDAEYLPGTWGQRARIRQVRISSVEHAPLLSGTHPLLILSPGMGRIPTDYSTLAEDLASFGYIVSGVTPTGSSRLVVFPDGRIAKGTDGVDLERREQAQPLIERWVADFSFALDRLRSESMFSEHIDWSRVGVFGHSFGGAAAMHALKMDERFKRAANLDGAPQGVEVTGLTRPLLIINGAPLPASQKALNDKILEELKRICESDTAGCQIEDFPDAGHMNFSDAAVIPSRLPIPRSHYGLTGIDGPAFLQRVSDLLRRFFDQM